VSSPQRSLAADPLPLRTHVIMRYDTGRYPFAAVLQRDVFGVPRLELLHEHYMAAGRKQGPRTGLTQEDNLAARELMQDLPRWSAARCPIPVMRRCACIFLVLTACRAFTPMSR
jgi:hypothetical protein